MGGKPVEKEINFGIIGKRIAGISPSTSAQFNLSSFAGIIFTTHSSTPSLGHMFIVASSNFVKQIDDGTNVTMTISNNVLTVTNNSGGTIGVFAIILSGSITAV